MRGHLSPRGDDTWQFTVELPRGADGKRRQKHVTVKGKKAAEAALAKAVHEINSGTYIDPTNLTLAAFLKKWMEHAATVVAGKTLEEYRKTIDGHIVPSLGRIPLAKLKPLHIQGYYADRLTRGRKPRSAKPTPPPKPGQPAAPKVAPPPGLSAQTVRHHHTLLHKALQDAVRWELIASNPCDAATPPRVVRQEMQILSKEEIINLLNETRTSSYHILVVLAVSTGMRRGEILALRWDDIDLDGGSITVGRSLQQTRSGLMVKGTKTGKTRVVSISGKTIAELRFHRAKLDHYKSLLDADEYTDNGLVCPKPDGNYASPNVISCMFRDYVIKAKITRVRLHDLRHTHVALLISQGEHVKVISERLGHSSISITMDRYGHLFPALNRSAADHFDDALGW
jgi:integrase